jgi:hypothetical protein
VTSTLCAAMFSNSYIKWRLRYMMLRFVAVSRIVLGWKHRILCKTDSLIVYLNKPLSPENEMTHPPSCYSPFSYWSYWLIIGEIFIGIRSSSLGWKARICKRSIPRIQFRQPIRSLESRYFKKGLRTVLPRWESIPGLHKRSTNTGSGLQSRLWDKVRL